MANITGMFFYRNKCYPLSDMLQVTISSFSRTAHRHIGRDTIELLQRKTADFISPELWSPNSPDLNPVDYKIWGIMQQLSLIHI